MAQPDPRRSMKPWLPHRSFDDPFYEHQAYPKMMTKICTEADLKDWMEHNNYVENGKVSYRGSRPVVGTLTAVLDASRQPVIVNSAEEEAAFLKINPAGENVVRVEVPAAGSAMLEALTRGAAVAQEEMIKDKEDEIEELKEKLAKAKRPIVRRRRHWAKRKPAPPLPQELTAVDSDNK